MGNWETLCSGDKNYKHFLLCQPSWRIIDPSFSLRLIVLVVFILPIWQSAKLADYRQSKTCYFVNILQSRALFDVDRTWLYVLPITTVSSKWTRIGLLFYQRALHLFLCNTKCLAQLGRAVTPKRQSPGKPMSLGEMKMLSNNYANPSYPRYDR